jgi:mono/diheme cytochrome c family protein
MMKKTLAIAAAVGLAAAGVAWTLTSAQAPAPAAPQPDYHPSFGDLMTMAVQPRHIKLGLAGKARNWDYAAYEASELRNAFGRIGRTIPAYRKQALPDMFAANILPSMDKLDAAIKAKDGSGFDAAYKEVTASCNNCHGALDHGFVVIREPTSSPYTDQNLGGGTGGATGKSKAKDK